MLQRLAFAAAADHFAQWRQFRFGQLALKLEIKLDPFPAENVRKQVLGIETRVVDPAFLEIVGARLQHLQNSHATDDSFSRSAMSAACSELIISPRSPSITRSRL